MQKWTTQGDKVRTTTKSAEKPPMPHGQSIMINVIFCLVSAFLAISTTIVLAGTMDDTTTSPMAPAPFAFFLIVMVVLTIVFFFQAVNAAVRYNVAKSSPQSSARVEP